MASLDGDPTRQAEDADGPAPAAAAAGHFGLRAALRRARLDAAERTDVLAELRGAEIARLEMLHEALAPVLDAVPPDADLFDAGLVPGVHPRLFIDMIAFVEMGRDRRLYRFQQDTRYGRTLLAESERLDTMTDAVTAYIARRLVERERAMAGAPAVPAAPVAEIIEAAPRAPAPRQRSRGMRRLGATTGFLVDLLGTAALVLLLLAGLWYAGASLLAWANSL